MTALALGKAGLRTNTITMARVLAVALSAAIPLSNSATTVISILLALACLLYMERTTWSLMLKNPVTIAIFLYVLLSIIDISFTLAAPKEISLGMRKVMRLLYFPLLLPLFAPIKWRHYANMAYLFAVLISVIAAMLYTWSFFKDTIFTSMFIAYGIFMLAHYSAEYKEYRALTIPTALFFMFYLFFIGTGRAGQLLFFMLFGLFLLQRMKFTWRVIVPAASILSLIIAACCIVPSSFLIRQQMALAEVKDYIQTAEAQVSHESSLGVRFILAHNSLELIKQKPMQGFGTGSFRAAYATYAPEAKYNPIKRANPHNQYLLTWVELGIPGFSLLLFLFASLAWTFNKSKHLDGYLGLGLVLVMAIGCTMNSWLLDFTSAFFFVFFAAVYMAGSLGLARAEV